MEFSEIEEIEIEEDSLKIKNISARTGNNFMLYMLLWALVSQLLFGTISEVLSLIGIPMGLGTILITGQVLSLFLPFLVYVIVKRKKVRLRELLPMKKLGIINILIMLGMLIALYPTIMFLAAVSSLVLPNVVPEVMENLFNYHFLIGFFIIAIVPSIFEEITFRGIIYHEYKNVKIHKSALMNGLFFGIIHLNFHQFIYAFILGILLTYLTYYTRSFLAPFLAHVFFNGSQFILGIIATNLTDSEIVQYATTVYEEPSMLIMLIALAIVATLFFPLFVLLFWVFKKHNEEKHGKIQQPQTGEKVWTLSVWFIVPIFLIVATLFWLVMIL
ncbi:MAG: CPBP family intramembrane metalloprotease [Defluviitaleaceae bacterium]|nr:CPBP family intramembrane metalloprotease [Defluviitaleaceae bacterium]